MKKMKTIRASKVKRCECGRTAAEGSVFCSHCRADVNRRNAKISRGSRSS